MVLESRQGFLQGLKPLQYLTPMAAAQLGICRGGTQSSDWVQIALFGGILFQLLIKDFLKVLPFHKLVDVSQQQPHGIALQALGAEVGLSKSCGTTRDLFDLLRVP